MREKWLFRIIKKSITLTFIFALANCSQVSKNEGGASQLGKQQKGESQSDIVHDKKSIAKQPNILLIVVDDLGYADIGAFGSEINTPNLDALANAGMKLTNFHTAPTCSPTRSMLLSGTDNHLAGLGSMSEFMKHAAPYLLDKPGYEGYLNDRVASLPEVIAKANYQTFMVGKWHLGSEVEHRPTIQGFERSFALMDGGSGHFDDMAIFPTGKKSLYFENDKQVSLPKDFYSTPFYTNKMKQFIAERNSSKPFLSYLAYTAPHWPLQAPESSIAKFKGKYDDGYEALLVKRLAKQKELGLIAQSAQVPPLPQHIKPWHSLTAEEKKYSAKKMEIYAAMVSDLDNSIGDLITELKDKGIYDNTMIFFMSDNGAEHHTPDDPGFSRLLKGYLAECCDNSFDNMGKANSYIMYGPEWARAGNVLNRLYKGTTAQGGINTPAFVHFPKMIKANSRYDGFVSVMDLMPTMLEVADVAHPYVSTESEGGVLPMRGTSMLDMLTNKSKTVHSDDYVMGWELFGGKSVRKGDWKLLLVTPPLGNGKWALYDLANDPTEQNDLSVTQPEKFEEMKLVWQQYAQEVGVQPLRASKTKAY